MGLFNRKPKPQLNKKEELLEWSSTPAINYVPLIGQMQNKGASETDDLLTYRLMEKDAIVSGAMELWAADATQVSLETGHAVWIECSNSKLKDELEEFLYQEVDIESKLYIIAKTIARDGKFFFKTYDNLDKWYFEPVNNLDVLIPLFDKGNIVGYYVEDNKKGYVVDADNYIAFISGLGETPDKIKLRENDREKEYGTTKGRSFLEGDVIAWRILTVLEDSLMQARVAKSSIYNIVGVEVGNATKKEADKFIEEAKKVFKTTEAIDLVNGMYKSANSPIAAKENIYNPKRNGVGAIDIQTIGGDMDLKEAFDIEYFRNKHFAALHTPKAYLGFDGEANSILGDNSLTRADERYCRHVERLRAVVRQGLVNLCDYYLRKTGQQHLCKKYKVCMTAISSSEEKTRREEMASKIANAQAVVDLAVNNFSNQINKDKLFSFVFNNLLGISTSNISDMKDNNVKVINYGNRGSGFGSAGRREIRLKNGIKSVDNSMLDSYDIYLDMNDKVVPLREATSNLDNFLNEVTYKQLKDRVKNTDPERLRRSKKLTTSYIGLNRAGDLLFKTTSQTTPGKFWYQTIRLLDLPEAIRLFGEDESITDREIISLAISGDIACYCNDPSYKYWGWQWMSTVDGYGIVPEDRAPTVRNTELKGAVCKHLTLVLNVLPFWTSQIVKDLRKQFFREKDPSVRAQNKVTYDKGKKQEYKLNDTEGDDKNAEDNKGNDNGEK